MKRKEDIRSKLMRIGNCPTMDLVSVTLIDINMPSLTLAMIWDWCDVLVYSGFLVLSAANQYLITRPRSNSYMKLLLLEIYVHYSQISLISQLDFPVTQINCSRN